MIDMTRQEWDVFLDSLTLAKVIKETGPDKMKLGPHAQIVCDMLCGMGLTPNPERVEAFPQSSVDKT